MCPPVIRVCISGVPVYKEQDRCLGEVYQRANAFRGDETEKRPKRGRVEGKFFSCLAVRVSREICGLVWFHSEPRNLWALASHA